MIQITNKNIQNYIFIPCNVKKIGQSYTMHIVNTLSKIDVNLNVTDADTYDDFYVFAVNTSTYDNGEYEYEVKDSMFNIVSTGILRISVEEDTVIVKTKKSINKINNTIEPGTIKTLTLD